MISVSTIKRISKKFRLISFSGRHQRMHQLVSNYFFQLRSFVFLSSQFNPIVRYPPPLFPPLNPARSGGGLSPRRIAVSCRLRNLETTNRSKLVRQFFRLSINDRFKLSNRFYHKRKKNGQLAFSLLH